MLCLKKLFPTTEQLQVSMQWERCQGERAMGARYSKI